MTELDIGTHKSYINNYPGFKHLVDIPTEAAIAWVKGINSGDKKFMDGDILVKDLSPENIGEAWPSKFWVIVNADHEKWIALNSHDNKFSIYVKQFE